MDAYDKLFPRTAKDPGSPVVELGGANASPEHTVSDDNMLDEPSPKRARLQAASPQSKIRVSTVSDVLGPVQRKPRTSRPTTSRHKASSSLTADEQDPDDKAAAEALLGFSTMASTSSPIHRPSTSRAQTPTRRGGGQAGSPLHPSRYPPSNLQPSNLAPGGRGRGGATRQPDGGDTPKAGQGPRSRRGAGPTASPVKTIPVVDTKPQHTNTASGKSELTLLCERFLERYGRLRTDGRAAEIQLKDVAVELGVPRRRLYDIINVLEAVEMVVRTGKLQYEWQGVAHLPQLLQQLAKEEADGMPVEDRSRRGPPVVLRPMNPLLVLPSGRASPQSSAGGSGSAGAVASASGAHHEAASSGGAGPNAVQRARAALGGGAVSKEHTSRSLWMLSRKFVRLLLTHTEPIPLVEAAAKLVTLEEADSPVYMTVERRLYDIGSILSCIGLIQKTYMGRNVCRARQPAYQWNANWQRDLLAGIADKSASLPPPRAASNGTTHAPQAAARSHQNATESHAAPSANPMAAASQMYMPMAHSGMMPTGGTNTPGSGQQATAGTQQQGPTHVSMQGGHHQQQAAAAYPTASSGYPATGAGAAAYQQQAAAAAAAAAAAYPYGPYPLQMMGHVLGMNAGMPMPFMLPQQPGVPTSQPATAGGNPYQMDPATAQKMYSMNPLSFLPGFMASPHPYFTHPAMAMSGHPNPAAAPNPAPPATTAGGPAQQPTTSPQGQAPAAAFPSYPPGMAYATHPPAGTAGTPSGMAPAMMGHPVPGSAAAPVMPMPMPFMFNYAPMMSGAPMMAAGAVPGAAGAPHPHAPQQVPQQHHHQQPMVPPQQQQQPQQQQHLPQPQQHLAAPPQHQQPLHMAQQQVQPQQQQQQQPMMHMPQQQPQHVPPPQQHMQMGQTQPQLLPPAQHQLLPHPHHTPQQQHLPPQQHLPQQQPQHQHHLPHSQQHLHPQQQQHHVPHHLPQPQLPQPQQPPMHMQQMHAPVLPPDANCSPLPYAPLPPPAIDASAASAAAAAVAAAATAAMQSGGISA